MTLEHLCAPVEVKFAEADAPAGTFEGMASVFGVVDAHGDACAPGCFAQSLAEHKARGSMPIMFAMHGPVLGADPLPAGVYTDMRETDSGLYVKGRVSALDTDYGRRIRSLVADGALGALSIGFRVPANGATYNSKARPERGEARRTLKTVRLIEVSLVPTGSNPAARVQHIKTDLVDAIEEFRAAVARGEPPEVRAFERLARDALGLTRAQAELLAERGYKALCTRESGSGEANQAAEKAAREMRNALDGFSLPSF